jgi:tetratricopeptide (TPR) repeat protein
VLRDHRRAYTEDSIALALSPSNAEVLAAVAWDEVSLGRWEAAREHFKEAVRLDPRSVVPADGLALVLLYTRHHSEAEKAYRRILQTSPANLNPRLSLAAVSLARGDLSAAQAVLRGAPEEVDPTELVAFVAYYWDLYWVLDEAQQQLVLRLTPSAFGDDRGSWGLVLAEIYDLQGNQPKARAYADSARLAYEQQLLATPEDALRRACLSTALAYMGRKDDAVREGKHGVRLLPISRDAWIGPYIQHQLVRTYILVGELEKAVDELEPLLKIPYHLAPGWLRIDPTFDPLRGDPRFKRLLESEQDAGVVRSATQ